MQIQATKVKDRKTKMSQEWFKENKQRCISKEYLQCDWLMMQVSKDEVILLVLYFSEEIISLACNMIPHIVNEEWITNEL